MIGAGLAVVALGGAGVGLGVLFGSYLEARRSATRPRRSSGSTAMMTFALVEATGLIGFVIAMIILFG